MFCYSVFFGIIIMLFPLLVYFIYNCYMNLNTKKYDFIFLDICCISSLYLTLTYIKETSNYKLLLFCNILLVLSFLKKRNFLSIVICSSIVLYSFCFFKVNIITLIIKYLIYFVIYIYFIKKNKSSYFLIELIAIIQGFFLAFEQNFITDNQSLVSVLFDTVIFFIILIICMLLIDSASKITELFVDYKQLEKEKKLKESLFKITHEIKNPIAVCKGYLDMLDVNNQSKVTRYVPIIKEEIDRCLNIVTDFMEFSKIKIEKDIIDVNLLLDEISDSVEILLKSNKIDLDYQENKAEYFIMGDFNRLKQVLLNFIKNSIEAIDKEGRIIIKSYKKNNNIIIEIKDNGIGMTKEELEKVTEIFYTTKANGTGIGVALSKEIILAHSGNLKYESEKNKGTTVKIELPLMKNI